MSSVLWVFSITKSSNAHSSCTISRRNISSRTLSSSMHTGVSSSSTIGIIISSSTNSSGTLSSSTLSISTLNNISSIVIPLTILLVIIKLVLLAVALQSPAALWLAVLSNTSSTQQYSSHRAPPVKTQSDVSSQTPCVWADIGSNSCNNDSHAATLLCLHPARIVALAEQVSPPAGRRMNWTKWNKPGTGV